MKAQGRRWSAFGLALAAVVLVASPSFAVLTPSWDRDGLVVSSGDGTRGAITVVPDDRGGVYLVWEERLTDDFLQIHAQHLKSDGTPASGWDIGGLQVSPYYETVSAPIAVGDDHGGLWVVWMQMVFSTPCMRIAHFPADGPVFDDLGQVKSRFVTSSQFTQRSPLLAVSPNGDAHVTWGDDRGPYSTRRRATLRMRRGLVGPSGLAANGTTLNDDLGGGSGGYVGHGQPVLTLVSPSRTLVAPHIVSTESCHHGCSSAVYWEFATVDTNLLVDVFYAPLARDGILAIAPRADRHSGFDMLVPRVGGGTIVGRITSTGVTEWSYSIGGSSEPTLDHHVQETSDGGMMYTRLRSTAAGMFVDAAAFGTDGTPLPPIPSVRVDEPGRSSPLVSRAADSRAGVAFVRSITGLQAGDLWLGRVSPGLSSEAALIPLAVAPGEQSGAAMARATDGAILVAWLDTRSGSHEVRMQRLVEESSTPVQAISLFTERVGGAVRLQVRGGANESVRLERSRTANLWESLAELHLDRDGVAVYLDREEQPAGWLGYRAVSGSGSSDEIWIEWAPHVAFGLHSVASTRGSSTFSVSLTIEPQAPADLELFDLLGRRIDRVRIAAGTEGRKSFELGSTALRSGVMLVRLSQAGQVATMRAVVLR